MDGPAPATLHRARPVGDVARVSKVMTRGRLGGEVFLIFPVLQSHVTFPPPSRVEFKRLRSARMDNTLPRGWPTAQSFR